MWTTFIHKTYFERAEWFILILINVLLIHPLCPNNYFARLTLLIIHNSIAQDSRVFVLNPIHSRDHLGGLFLHVVSHAESVFWFYSVGLDVYAHFIWNTSSRLESLYTRMAKDSNRLLTNLGRFLIHLTDSNALRVSISLENLIGIQNLFTVIQTFLILFNILCHYDDTLWTKAIKKLVRYRVLIMLAKSIEPIDIFKPVNTFQPINAFETIEAFRISKMIKTFVTLKIQSIKAYQDLSRLSRVWSLEPWFSNYVVIAAICTPMCEDNLRYNDT